MKNLSNVLAVLGVLLVVYSVIGRFLAEPSIGMGIIKISGLAGLAMANSLMLISIILKLGNK